MRHVLPHQFGRLHLDNEEIVRAMVAAPWYLFSFGIVLVMIGAISGAMSGAGRSSRNRIDSRMSDAEIARRLERQSSVGFPGLIFFLGLLCLLVSLGWRLLRWFR
jgi:hypothetical protein